MAKYKDATVTDVLAAYERGERLFEGVDIEQADFNRCILAGARFQGASLRAATFDQANLSWARFLGCDLSGASLVGATLHAGMLEAVDLSGARLAHASLLETSLWGGKLNGADLTRCELLWTHLSSTDLDGTKLDGVVLANTAFSDVDVSHLCDALVHHAAPSYVDFRSVLRSRGHPGLKRFLVDCGVPPLVAEYTIEAARAEGDALASLMRSTFISYGGPDEAFARRLYEELRAHGVTTFFFPETARLGRRIGDEVHSRIQEHDRVILVCSRESLDRPGVRNEIQETFDREARDGGATYLIPIRLDDYVLSGWDDPLAARVRDRVVGDFTGTLDDARKFDREMSRLLAELRKDPG